MRNVNQLQTFINVTHFIHTPQKHPTDCYLSSNYKLLATNVETIVIKLERRFERFNTRRTREPLGKRASYLIITDSDTWTGNRAQRAVC